MGKLNLIIGQLKIARERIEEAVIILRKFKKKGLLISSDDFAKILLLNIEILIALNENQSIICSLAKEMEEITRDNELKQKTIEMKERYCMSK